MAGNRLLAVATASEVPGPFAFSDSGEIEGGCYLLAGAIRGTYYSYRPELVQEVLPIQRIPLRWPKSRVADDAAQFFFGGAVVDAGGAHYIFF